MKKTITHFLLKEFIFYVTGCVIFSAAVTMFVSPNNISPGGLTGIATALNFLFKIPGGITLFLLNIPILIIGFIKFGGLFIIKTGIVTAILSPTLDVSEALLPAFKIDKILAAVFGGIFMGFGISLILKNGATTGGVDIIAKLINKRFPHFTVGKIILLVDALVILFAAIVYKNIETVLYSVISMYCASKITDFFLYGSDKGKLMFIISEKAEEISRDINKILKRGATLINSVGTYTKKPRKLLLCTLRIYEVSEVYKIINNHDKKAFVVLCEVGEILGEGFKEMK